MTSLKRSLPVLTLLTASAAASAQASPQLTIYNLTNSSLDLTQASEDPHTPAPPMPPMLPVRVVERSDVVAVRQEITALRLACAAMPAHTYTTIGPAMLPASRTVPEPMTERPYAPEEDACAAVLNPDRAGAGYAVQIGLIGAGLTLLALMFATLIGGVLRVLWNGPMARAFPMIFNSKFRG
jgi:hypothetical protein